ncbi:glycosyltransferase [Marinimicrobium sp. LS-A18]|uniref:glycosyltransferase family 2 protein n=1 Tax=Marinimicrobium sp. LS-A18 TaxID=1381596 RepID=UPI000464E9A0|nr:glycosyltransferase [Marinimicrobium sp. LS-A18]
MQSISLDRPLVSVVIATYNMGCYLDQAIDSVLAQSWDNVEVIVVDDGSTDETATLMSRYKDDIRINYIQNENQGQPRAKNCGIRHACGDYIAFCDADDLWHPDKLSHQMPLFDDPEVGVVYSEVSNIDEYNRRYEQPPPYVRYQGSVTNQLLIRNFVPFGTAVIRRECVEKSGAFDEQFRMGIDWDLWLRYSLDWKFAYTPEKTYIYREWSGQMSNNYRGRYKHALRILRKFVESQGASLPARTLRRAWADTYINQANAIVMHEGKFLEPLSIYAKGIGKAPTYWYGWKSLIKWMIGRHRKKPA